MTETDGALIYSLQGAYSEYKLYQQVDEENGDITLVLTADGDPIEEWDTEFDYVGTSESDFETTEDYNKMIKSINSDEGSLNKYFHGNDADEDDDDDDDYSTAAVTTTTTTTTKPDYSKYYSKGAYDDYSDYYGGKSWANYYAELEAKRKAELEKDPEMKIDMQNLNNSDTLVIHCKDHSTDMLAQVYEGKGWDVIRNGNINQDDLIQLIQSHDKIVCLGHGTPSGLINKQGYGYVINDRIAPYLKDKKLFCIWCYAATFLKNHGLHGHFCSDNAPSEKWECAVVGFNVSAQWILESITYWCKCCADVAEQALGGDPQGAVERAQKMYWDKYGNDDDPDQLGVSKFNTNTLQVS